MGVPAQRRQARSRGTAAPDRRLLERLAASSRDAFLTTSTAGTIVDANESALVLFGAPRKLLLRKPLSTFTGEPSTFRGALARAAAGEPVEGTELTIQPPSGEPIAVVADAALDAQGRVSWVFVATEPIGLAASADLSAQARRDEAERNFVANAAHELRTPLASIAGAVEVLQAGAKEVPEERDRFLDHITRECDRLKRLATALLTLARAETGTEPPRLDLVELRPMLRRVASGLRPPAGVTVRVDCASTVAALANSDLLEQALLNLAENAAAHTRHGEIAITAAEAGPHEVCISVADTGVGMSLAEQQRSLERFQRGADSEGFGLGLAIAAQSLRALGSVLTLDSAPGRGTTARAILPAGRIVGR